MRTLKLAALIGIIALTGCATTANYEKILNSWVGSDELSLIRTWGTPARTYEVSGVKFLEFQRSRNIYIPGTAPTYQTTMVGNTAYTRAVGGTAATNVAVACTTTFEVVNSRIQSWRYQGNDCVATDPK